MADYTLSAKVTADVSNFMKGFSELNNKLESLSEKTKAVSAKVSDFGKSTMATGAKITAMTLPITMMGKSMLQAGMNFESTMSEVQAISGATGKDLDSLKNKAQEMGAKTKFSATESAEALTYMAMAGWKTGDMLDGLEGIMDLAAASGEDLALTSDIVTDGLTGFGLQAKDSGHFADVLAAASSNANTNVSMLGESFKYVAPVAGALGFSIEDTSVALGLMANSGIKASQAGTSLRSAISKMVKPTKQAQGVMNEYGLSLTNSDGTMKSLGQIMGDLRKKMGGLDSATQAQAAATLFGQESMSGMLAIINAGEGDFDKLTEAINNSEGAAKEMADTMIDNLSGKITIIKSGIEGFYLSIYDQLLPAFNKIADVVQKFIDKLNSLSDRTKMIIGITGALVIALGPLIALFGAIATYGIAPLIGLLGAIISPIGLVISAIVGLSAAFGYQMSTNESFRNSFFEVFDSIKEKVSGVISYIAPIIQNMWATVQPILSSVASGIGSAFKNLGPQIIPAIMSIGSQIGAVFKTVWGIIQAVLPVFTTFFSSLINGFKSSDTAGSGFVLNLTTILFGLSPVVKGVILLFQNFGPQIVSAFQQVAAMLIPVMGTIGTAIGQLATTVIPLVMAALTTLIPIVVQVGSTFMNIVSAVLPVLISLFNQFVPIITQVVLIFADIIAQVIPLAGVLLSSLLPVIQNVIEAFMNVVTSVAPAFIAVIQAIMAVVQALVPIIMSIITVVVHVFSAIVSTISPIVAFVGTIISAVMSVITPIVVFVAGIVTSIVSTITPLITIVSGIFTTIFTIISGIFRNIMTFIAGIINSVGTIISGLTGVASSVFNTIFGTVSRVMGNVSSKITGVFEAIKSSWNGLTSFVDNIFSGISGSVQTLVGQVKGFVNGVIGGINSAVSLINKIPGVSIGAIPYLARGTDDFAGGFARINEGGRGELVNMPGGSQVIPHDVSMKYAREAGKASRSSADSGRSETIYEGDVHVHIDKFENHTERDLETLSYDLGWMTKRERGRLSSE